MTRLPLAKPETKKVGIEFNGETITGLYNFIDARTGEEKSRDRERGMLAGAVIVFLTGHAQRPADAFKLANDLAVKSRSGIAVVPVCDTPYGMDGNWRGDRGKDVVLMEMVRFVLAARGITVPGYKPLTDMPVRINGQPMADGTGEIIARLVVTGWSHGGLLSRRMASAYPEAVDGMGQACPAGYKQWQWRFVSLLAKFFGECLLIAPMLFTRNAVDVTRASFGIVKGVAGDLSRAIISAIRYGAPSRLFRIFKDLADCTLLGNDNSLPLGEIKNVVVIFAKKDSVIQPGHTGVTDPDNPAASEIKQFWRRFYFSLADKGITRKLMFLPGNHLAPIPYHDLYSSILLKHLGQLKD